MESPCWKRSLRSRCPHTRLRALELLVQRPPAQVVWNRVQAGFPSEQLRWVCKPSPQMKGWPLTSRLLALQPNEIQNAVLPKSGPVLQHVRKVLADAGRKLSWVVLDVVSDRESSGDPYEPLHMSAVYYGIDHLMVTTRKQIQESLGPVAASRKRLRGSLQGGGALLASSAGGSGESAQSMHLDE